MISFEWATELLVIRRRRPFAANRVLTDKGVFTWYYADIDTCFDINVASD